MHHNHSMVPKYTLDPVAPMYIMDPVAPMHTFYPVAPMNQSDPIAFLDILVTITSMLWIHWFLYILF